MLFINANEIVVPEDRIRRDLDESKLQELVESIEQRGIIHPPVVRIKDGKYILVAGFRRLRAMRVLTDVGAQIKTTHDDTNSIVDCLAPQGQVPALRLSELNDIEAKEIELEENIIRDDISWQDRVRAIAEIHQMWKETRGEDWTKADTGEAIFEDDSKPVQSKKVSEAIMLANSLDNALVAKADNPSTALKIIKRQRENEASATFADFLKANSPESEWIKLNHGDCLHGLYNYSGEPFDLFLMDPPYGVNAQEFNQGDVTGTESYNRHKYDDAPEYFVDLMQTVIPVITGKAAEQSIVYQFCDLKWWHFLSEIYKKDGWKVWPWPLIWIKRGRGLNPSPEYGPQRRYETILYANRGKKRLRLVKSDVLDQTNVVGESKIHAARKPVWVMRDLIERSCPAGSYICDPFMGTGPTAVACKREGMYFAGWEKDEDTFKQALVRVQTDHEEEEEEEQDKS